MTRGDFRMVREGFRMVTKGQVLCQIEACVGDACLLDHRKGGAEFWKDLDLKEGGTRIRSK